MQLGLTTNPCNLCPRRCGVDRSTQRGYCGAPAEPAISSVTIHTGEEPPLSAQDGIVNVFFAHCNLHCIYCQNWQISGRQPFITHHSSLITHHSSLTTHHSPLITHHSSLIAPLLQRSNGLLGFVTAAHYAHLIPQILDDLHAQGLYPTVVYNSSGYESVDTLRALEGLVDIYLPDFKYIDPDLADRYSHAPDYPQVALDAINEMIRQVGAGLKVDSNGIAYRGIIVRHLVLPGHIDNSLAVLDRLSSLNAEHITSNTLHLSLMSQYYPPLPGLPAPIDRTLSPEEYDTVAKRFNQLGFDGWLQTPDANANYRPDFDNPSSPFTT